MTRCGSLIAWAKQLGAKRLRNSSSADPRGRKIRRPQAHNHRRAAGQPSGGLDRRWALSTPSCQIACHNSRGFDPSSYCPAPAGHFCIPSRIDSESPQSSLMAAKRKGAVASRNLLARRTSSLQTLQYERDANRNFTRDRHFLPPSELSFASVKGGLR
jgi:hypothetical protein